MDNGIERDYAWRMVRAARRAHAYVGSGAANGAISARRELDILLQEALDAGLDRSELVAVLADLAGRLLMLCDPVGDGDHEP